MRFGGGGKTVNCDNETSFLQIILKISNRGHLLCFLAAVVLEMSQHMSFVKQGGGSRMPVTGVV